MYRIPSLENVSKVIIDAAVIDGFSEPLLMFETQEQLQDPVAEEQG
jgi:ATP-dependent Clp protease ATP-binding subunit ClpX